MEMRRFGDLSGPFIAPARGGIASSLIMLLHGWGADGNDLANLAHPISIRFPGAAFFFPTENRHFPIWGSKMVKKS